MIIIYGSITVLMETTIFMRIMATFGGSSVGLQEDVAFGGLPLRPLASFGSFSNLIQTPSALWHLCG